MGKGENRRTFQEKILSRYVCSSRVTNFILLGNNKNKSFWLCYVALIIVPFFLVTFCLHHLQIVICSCSCTGTVEVLQLVINLWSVISGAVCDLLKVNYVLRHTGLRDLRFTHKTSSLFVHNQNITCPLS